MTRLHVRPAVFALCLAAAIPGLGNAQVAWTVTSLHPAGPAASAGYGVSGNQQVGYVTYASDPGSHASLWSGTAASWVDLHPAGAGSSYANAVSGGQQVGSAEMGQSHAGLWNGSAASWVDLHPAGAWFSDANGVSGGQQVGNTFIDHQRFGVPG
jgi:hypothetical protein